MKIFVSWSGEFSKSIAKVLKTWLPSIIHTIDVFFSEDDIEKGQNWDKRLTSELTECNYGIVCLTPENVNAPWIHFEAGALVKTYESRVTAFMINIKTSDIKGPLSRFQATRFDREDFYSLMQSINKSLEAPIAEDRLQKTYEAIWPKLEYEIKSIIDKNPKKAETKEEETKKDSSAAIEEILQLLRRQNSILSNPKEFFPFDLLELSNYLKNISTEKISGSIISVLYTYMRTLNNAIRNNEIQENIDHLTYDFLIATQQFLTTLFNELRSENTDMLNNLWNYYRELTARINRLINMYDKRTIIDENNEIVTEENNQRKLRQPRPIYTSK